MKTLQILVVRNKVCEYEERTGIDLVKEAFDALTEKLAGIMGLDPSLKEWTAQWCPPVLRRRYGIDKMREKGLVRKRQRLGLKLMAVNAGRLFKWQEDKEKTERLSIETLLSPYISRFSFRSSMLLRALW